MLKQSASCVLASFRPDRESSRLTAQRRTHTWCSLFVAHCAPEDTPQPFTRCSLAERTFEHPGKVCSCCVTRADHRTSSVPHKVFPRPARIDTGSRGTATPGSLLVAERDRCGTAARAEKVLGERLDDGRVIALAAENIEVGVIRIVRKMAADQRRRNQLHHGIAGDPA